MKTKIFSIISVLIVFGTFSLFAQTVKIEKFKVYGNCESCKVRIEKAALSVDGVTKANWDVKTKVLELTFNPAKTNPDKVQLAIANVGHDTEKHRATDKVYNSLPECCKYERAKK